MDWNSKMSCWSYDPTENSPPQSFYLQSAITLYVDEDENSTVTELGKLILTGGIYKNKSPHTFHNFKTNIEHEKIGLEEE